MLGIHPGIGNTDFLRPEGPGLINIHEFHMWFAVFPLSTETKLNLSSSENWEDYLGRVSHG